MIDDYDDPPTLHPVPPEFREDYRELPVPASGFGFWMAVAWCLIYFVVMQIIAGLAIGIPAMIVAVLFNEANGKPVPLDMPGMVNDPAMSTALLVTLIGSHIVGLLFSWIILRWQVGRQWKRRIALSRLPSPTHAVLVLLGFPAMLALSVGAESLLNQLVPSMEDIFRKLGIPMEWPGIEALMPLLQQTPWPVALVAVAILPALNEEFWCRGFLGQGLSARYVGWIVVLIVSFLFGCLHMDTRQGLGAMMLGAVIHASYLATRSLWVAMAVHFINNGLAVIHVNAGIGLPILQPLEDVMGHSPLLFTLSAALLFASVGYALYQTRCKLAPVEPGMPSWEPKGVSGVELPPPNSGTIVTHDPMSPLSVALVLTGAVAFAMVMAFA